MPEIGGLIQSSQRDDRIKLPLVPALKRPVSKLNLSDNQGNDLNAKSAKFSAKPAKKSLPLRSSEKSSASFAFQKNFHQAQVRVSTRPLKARLIVTVVTRRRL